MNIVSQQAKKRERILKYSEKKGVTAASRMYGISRQSIYRWKERYDGTWQSLKEKSHRPNHHPKQHTAKEERQIRNSYREKYERYGWDGVYVDLQRKGYRRSYSGMIYAAKRMGLQEYKAKKGSRKHDRRYPEVMEAGEKVQIDVKEVPFNCLRGKAIRDGLHMYQWTAIDECTRMRFVYAFYEHTPENTVKFFKMLEEKFPFKIQTVQTDNGTEFTYKFISEDTSCPFDEYLASKGIKHVLIPPRTPWHNGKVERSHRNDQRYFYDWETFSTIEELNEKLKGHLEWSNNKVMRSLGNRSPVQMLKEKMGSQ